MMSGTPSKSPHPLLHVHFWLPRDPTQYEGLASDRIYGQGVEFVTHRAVALRQMIRVSLAVQPPGGEVGEPTPPVPAEVTHIEALENGWRVYATFLDPQAAVDIPAKDRRRQPRHPTHLRGEYMLVEGMPPRPCLVEDISRSGAALETDQAMRIGRHFVLRVHSADKKETHPVLESIVEVRRSQHKGDGVYDIGVLFLHRRDHPDDKTPAHPSGGDSKTPPSDESVGHEPPPPPPPPPEDMEGGS